MIHGVRAARIVVPALDPRAQAIIDAAFATVSDGIAVFARGDVTYQSQMQVEEMNIAQIQARTLVNARVGFAKNNWSADIWGKNILDKKYISNSFFIISGTGYSVAMGERQTYGMTLRYKF